jgi:hypothetical protein
MQLRNDFLGCAMGQTEKKYVRPGEEFADVQGLEFDIVPSDMEEYFTYRDTGITFRGYCGDLCPWMGIQ